ncbi:carboxylate/amino acid/amine transporter [Paenibacillus larvae subsp. larvae]|uniref:Carboxylate/amino acid/amine transporter n=1 Tax=Paenibacillus larvae subsp. larvae TaxID=147375 RepID=A0A2L1UCU4_9BACL|nr:DMT family transporter [Paenibacillus larvae]AQT86393.1 hypothetical protein B1222_21465 [Paenibacillus larvae subsp. pulvifaciens]AVF25969.1 carboxylate/amino acid/amine transporter [Paenibacillus larvae subsp. larvae]AVF30746.1 carboxylate/amino acid/amine transporter [Paenibacillus larvae subsp. larvae]MCY7520973.1 DMT family transporter [Paenibacillus larvae]MCY9502465.1 DMT family transporter [Paenibacillus larvae]
MCCCFAHLYYLHLILGGLNAAILNSLTTPLFSALVAWGWMKEKLTLGKWFGIILGIVGVNILVGWSSIPLTLEVILAAGLSILSTVSYGFGDVYAKKAFADVSPLSVAIGQQIGASVLLIPFTLFNLPTSMASLTPAAIFSVLGWLSSVQPLLVFLLNRGRRSDEDPKCYPSGSVVWNDHRGYRDFGKYFSDL